MMEKNGPKPKKLAGHRVVLFHRVLLIYNTHTHTHPKSIYANKSLGFSFFFFFFKVRTQKIKRASRNSVKLGSRVPPKMFPVGHGTPESTQAHIDIRIPTHARAQTWIIAQTLREV